MYKRQIEGTSYHKALSDVFHEYEKNKDLYEIELALERYVTSYAKALSMRYPFGMGPIIGYLREKESELHNLKVIVYSKVEKIEPKRVKELMIW